MAVAPSNDVMRDAQVAALLESAGISRANPYNIVPQVLTTTTTVSPLRAHSCPLLSRVR